jgi:DNA primase
MISQKSIQEVLDTAKVEDVVQDYVSLKRRGSNLIGLCPFHSEKTPSFSVSPSKNIYKCFGCGEGGGAVQFLMAHDHMSFPDAIRQLAKRYGIELDETKPSVEQIQEQQRQDSLFIVNQFALDYYQDQLFNTDRGKSVGLSYFKNRGFTEETIRKFGLGYAPPGKDVFVQEALKKGYDKELLRELGLMSKYDSDFFRDRVIFTIRNLSGKVIAFAGRIMQKDAKAPKYINSPETEIYHKSDVLYGAHFAKAPIRKADECILVEGYTDVISLHQAGIENVVASSGTSLTQGQIRLIKRNTQNIKILYDGDAAGIKAALRGMDLVLEQDKNVKVVLLPEGEDPDSYLQSVGPKAFKEYIDQQARDFILFKTELLLDDAEHDPIKRSEHIQDIMASVARIPDPVKRSVYVRELSRLTEMDEQVITNGINKILGQQLRQRQREQERQKMRKAREQQQEAPFPTTGDEPARAPVTEEPPTTESASSKDVYQEKEVIRILIESGSEWYIEEEQQSVASFILANIEDVLDDFQHETYQAIAREYLERLTAKEPTNTQYWLNHPKYAKLATDLISFPHDYSENWEKRWDVFLNQKDPEQNYRKDSEMAVKRLKMKKIKRKMEEVRTLIKDLSVKNDEAVLDYMQLFQHLKQMHDDIAGEFGSVVL